MKGNYILSCIILLLLARKFISTSATNANNSNCVIMHSFCDDMFKIDRLNEPRQEKTRLLTQKQRHRSAVQSLHC